MEHNMKITEKEYNALTGKTTITERDETTAETKARLDNAKEIATAQAAAEAKATAKAALLTQLGITEEQAKLLLS
jgi:hypothetical protein